MSAARAISRVKPIVALKAGRSKSGSAAASSHTGALAGADAVYEAAFRRAGIERVRTIEELFDCSELMAKQPLPSGPGLGIITNGGGPGVMAADSLSSFGLNPVSLNRDTIEKLDSFLPVHWSRGNPIDILGDASPERWKRTLEICVSAREIETLVVIFVPQNVTDPAAVAELVVNFVGKNPSTPLYAVWMGAESVQEGQRILNGAGVPTYETPERAICAFVHMCSYTRNLEILQQIPPKLPNSLAFDQAGAKSIIHKLPKGTEILLTEAESKTLLGAYGIPTNRTEVATTVRQAVRLAGEMGYPVAMKILTRDIVHKSDTHGVQLGLCSEKEVKDAFTHIMDSVRKQSPQAQLLGVTIQPTLERPDYEVIIGAKRDRDFGPVILFGMGGIMTEIVQDRAIALPPLNRLLARRLMESTKIYKMLKGYRNRPAARLEVLEEILMRVAQLVTDFPEISELDINPVIVVDDKAFAVDARITIKPSKDASPDHLVISPYPNQFETTAITKSGQKIFIRPIKPEDAPLCVNLFNTLSPQSIYYRFLGPLKSPPPKMLASLTQIDYDRDMALVAIDTTQKEERMLGVARLMSDPGGTKPEFAVLVGDPWQGQGIGASLMEHLIAIAKERGIKSLWGLALAENTNMLAFAQKMGFKISRIPDCHEYRMEMASEFA